MRSAMALLLWAASDAPRAFSSFCSPLRTRQPLCSRRIEARRRQTLKEDRVPRMLPKRRADRFFSSTELLRLLLEPIQVESTRSALHVRTGRVSTTNRSSTFAVSTGVAAAAAGASTGAAPAGSSSVSSEVDSGTMTSGVVPARMSSSSMMTRVDERGEVGVKRKEEGPKQAA